MTMHDPSGVEVFVCRHGRTSLNAAGLLRGRLDPDLDATGLAEAHALAGHLQPAGITRVVTSPLLRAVRTAESIAGAAHVPVVADARLSDRDYGGYAGRPAQEALSRYGSFDATPGVEPTAALRARVMAVFDELVAASQAGPVALVTHDAIAMLLTEALGWSQAPASDLQLATGGYAHLRHDGTGWRLVGEWRARSS